MVKDRLKALQAVIQENGNENGLEYDGLGVVNTTVNIEDEDAGYMERFFSEVVQIREWIDEINSNVNIIRTLHSKLLSSPRVDENVKNEVDTRSNNVKQLGKRINGTLKGLEVKIKQEEDELRLGTDSKLPAGLRIRKAQHSATLYLFVEAISKFNTEQVEYKERCEERIQRVISIAKTQVTDEKIEELLEQGNYGAIFNDDIITETLEVRKALEDVQVRHEELLKIEKSLRDLRDLFVEMALLVEQQGELIDRIENHVMRAAEHVEDARTDVKKAIKIQSKARYKKIIIIIVLSLILLGIILLFLFWKPS